MKKNFFKAFIAVAAIAAVGLGSYKVYGTYMAANLPDNKLLMAENIEALADDEIKANVRKRQETTNDITIGKYDNDGHYIGDSIIGYTHVVICVGSGVTPCTPGSDTHMFSDTGYKCTIGN